MPVIKLDTDRIVNSFVKSGFMLVGSYLSLRIMKEESTKVLRSLFSKLILIKTELAFRK